MTASRQQRVSLRSHDLDGDGLQDLAVASSATLSITTYLSSATPSERVERGEMLDGEIGCRCGRYGENLQVFDLARFTGEPGDPASSSTVDLFVGTSNGGFLREGTLVQGRVVLRCGLGDRLGRFVPIVDVKRGRFRCSDDSMASTGCAGREDLVLVGGAGLARAGDPGEAWVVFGTAQSPGADSAYLARPGAGLRLLPRRIEGRSPVEPSLASVGDVNGDGLDDLVLAFAREDGGVLTSPPAVRVFLGSGRGPLVESTPVDLSRLATAPGGTEPCRRVVALEVMRTNLGRDVLGLLCAGAREGTGVFAEFTL